MISIGEVNAAAQPLWPGFARLARYWFDDLLLHLREPLVAAVFTPGSAASVEPRHPVVNEGSVEKNCTPPMKS